MGVMKNTFFPVNLKERNHLGGKKVKGKIKGKVVPVIFF
jgi:hypothetical protein